MPLNSRAKTQNWKNRLSISKLIDGEREIVRLRKTYCQRKETDKERERERVSVKKETKIKVGKRDKQASNVS